MALARAAIAEAVNTVPDVLIAPRGSRTSTHLMNDGWVDVRRLAPAGYTTCEAIFEVTIVLGNDEHAAQDRFEEIATAAIDALTKAPDLYVSDVSVEPVQLVPTNGTGSIYALSINLSMEVS